MSSLSTDRRLGLNAGSAIKVPCRVASTANLTLSALQTVDGVALVAGDRVLAKDQTDATENGIWYADTGNWTRAPDFDGPNDVVTGSLVSVTAGTANQWTIWRVTNTGTITIDTTETSFMRAVFSDAASVAFTASGTGAVQTTVQVKLRETVSITDFGALPGLPTAATFNTAAINYALASGAKRVIVPDAGGLGFYINGQLLLPSNVEFVGTSRTGSIIYALTGFVSTTQNGMIYASGVSGAAVRNMTLQGDAASIVGGNYGVHFKTGAHNSVSDLTVKNTSQSGVWFEEQTYPTAVECYIYQCGTAAAYAAGALNAHGLLISTSTATVCSDITIDRVRVEQAYRKGFAMASNFAAPAAISRCSVTNCWAIDCGATSANGGGNFFFASEALFNDFTFENCHARNTLSADTGFQLQGINNLKVIGCSVEKATYGIYLSECNDAVIQGCRTKTTITDGIFVNPLAGAGTTVSTNIEVLGNIVLDANTGSTGTGIQANYVTRGRIQNNIVQNSTPSNGYGIYVDANSSDVKVGNNSVTGFNTASVQNLGGTKIDMLTPGVARCVLRFAGATGVVAGAPMNVNGNVGHAATGKFVVTFNENMPSVNYTVDVGKTAAAFNGDCIRIVTQAVGSVEFWIYENNALVDPAVVTLVIHCEQ